MTPLVTASPELKKLWIRVLKRVHPDLAVDEHDRRRCERLTQQANDAYARRDEAALRAVLEPKGSPGRRHAPPPPRAKTREVSPNAWEARAHAQPASQPPATVSRSEAFGILWAACAVLCILLYGIFDVLSEQVGRNTSLFLLVLLTSAVLWLITKNATFPANHKARWVAAVASGMILVGICLFDSHPRANPLFPSARAATAQGLVAPVSLKNGGNPPPSQWYWDVIKTRVEQSWNPSAVFHTPAGATADVAFTISHDGSPHDIELRRPSGSRSLDSSCVLAVQQVRTFGPPEGGTRDSLNVLYPCSYNQLNLMNAHAPQSNTPVETAAVMAPRLVKSVASQLDVYTERARTRLAQNWNPSEVAADTPAGATVYMQFAVRRRGNHEAPAMETSSGYSSLDASCVRALDRIRIFDRLPRGYTGDSLTVLYHCTYPGSATTKFAQDSILPPVQAPSPSGPVEGVHAVQQTANDTPVTN